MQKKQSEALRLLDKLNQAMDNRMRYLWIGEAAEELLRLHEMNAELINTVEDCLSLLKAIGRTTGGTYESAMRTFTKATKEQNAKH